MVGIKNLSNQTQKIIHPFIPVESLKVLFKDGLKLDSCFSGECALSTDEPADIDVTLASKLSPPEIFGIVAGSLLLVALAVGFIVAKIQQTRLRQAPPREPRSGVDIRFNKLSYVASGKSILNNMSGVVQAGRVLAILGPSGKI
jgi:hypothetical protein